MAAGAFVWGFQTYPRLPKWTPYALMAALGAVFMIAALVPLWRMPGAGGPAMAARDRPAPRRRAAIAELLRPFGDLRFLPLLAFGCWCSFFNGVTQSAQNYYPLHVLGIPLFLSLAVQTGMRLGQWGVSPGIGAVADRVGNRPVMFLSLLIVAAGLLMFAAATAEQPGWFVGAWVLWIAYAGMNVCLPNLLLGLSPRQSNTPYIAAYYAITGVCYAVSTIVGGALVDHFERWTFSFGSSTIAFFPCLFVFGWAARSLGALLLLAIRERD